MYILSTYSKFEVDFICFGDLNEVQIKFFLSSTNIALL